MENNFEGLVIKCRCVIVLRALMVNEIHVQIFVIMLIGNYSCRIIVRVS